MTVCPYDFRQISCLLVIPAESVFSVHTECLFHSFPLGAVQRFEFFKEQCEAILSLLKWQWE